MHNLNHNPKLGKESICPNALQKRPTYVSHLPLLLFNQINQQRHCHLPDFKGTLSNGGQNRRKQVCNFEVGETSQPTAANVPDNVCVEN